MRGLPCLCYAFRDGARLFHHLLAHLLLLLLLLRLLKLVEVLLQDFLALLDRVCSETWLLATFPNVGRLRLWLIDALHLKPRRLVNHHLFLGGSTTATLCDQLFAVKS